MSRARVRAPSAMPGSRRWWCDPGRGPRGRHAWSSGSWPARSAFPTSVHRIGGLGLQPWRTGLQIPDPLLIDQDPRRRPAVPGPAGERGGLRGGREAADPGAGTDRAGADAPGRTRAAHHDYVRHGTSTCSPAEYRHRQGDRPAIGPAPGDRLPRLPRPDRPADRPQPGHPRHLRQPVRAQGPRRHKWLLAHPRVQLHFTPTCSSWISQVERWFAELPAPLPGPRRVLLPRRAHHRPGELDHDLERHRPPFKWTKTADQIIDRICRYCSRISGPGH